MTHSTLLKPSTVDPSKAPIENVLQLTPLSNVGPDVFTNTRELWHPPAARGVFGGAVIAQSLAAAQETIPAPSPSNDNALFLIHSMHCYFVLPGDASIPILYHVERLREGKSFMTRTVQARQKGKCIFTTTCSFVREGSGGERTVDHEWEMPEGVADELRLILKDDEAKDVDGASSAISDKSPFISKRLSTLNQSSSKPHVKRSRQWLRARSKISTSGGQQVHLSALAYMSDSYFIGTISRVHNLWRFSIPLFDVATQKPLSDDRRSSSNQNTLSQTQLASLRQSEAVSLKAMAELEKSENVSFQSSESKATVGMMVSLDHTIYFHRPREIRADEWMFSEMESPWAGDGRGLVFQRIWSKGGRLLATCVQEGLVRLKQDGTEVGHSKL